MIKVAWGLIALDCLALILYFFVTFFYGSSRPADGVEKSFSLAIAGAGIFVILLSATPLLISRSHSATIFSAIISALPLLFLAWYFISARLKESGESRTAAEVHFSDKTERMIAAAISNGDTVALKQLIQGRDLIKESRSAKANGGLDYLDFTIRAKSVSNDKTFNEKANESVIRILVENGCPVHPDMEDIVRNLSPSMISYLIDAGADVNQRSEYNSNTPLLNVISMNQPNQNDVAKLLISKGADANALNKEGFTPVMYAAYISNVYDSRFSTWSLVRYLINDVHVDTRHTNENGYNLKRIVEDVSKEAKEQNVSMPEDFIWLKNWLKAS